MHNYSKNFLIKSALVMASIAGNVAPSWAVPCSEVKQIIETKAAECLSRIQGIKAENLACFWKSNTGKGQCTANLKVCTELGVKKRLYSLKEYKKISDPYIVLLKTRVEEERTNIIKKVNTDCTNGQISEKDANLILQDASLHFVSTCKHTIEGIQDIKVNEVSFNDIRALYIKLYGKPCAD